MNSLVDLVHVVSCSQSPFLEIVLEQEAAVVELVGVSLGFVLKYRSIVLFTYLFLPVSSMDVSSVLHIDVVKTLRWSESQVVVAWCSSLSEVPHGSIEEACHILRERS